MFAFKETSFDNIKGLKEAFAEMLLLQCAAVAVLSLKWTEKSNHKAVTQILKKTKWYWFEVSAI